MERDQHELLYIPKWLENNRSREIRNAAYFLCPIDTSNDEYLELVEHEDGAAHLGCWRAIQATAGSSHPRGTLLRNNGKPHTAATIARKTRLPQSLMETAIARLLDIGWLESQTFTTAELTAMSELPKGTCVKGAVNLRQTCDVPATELNRTDNPPYTPPSAKGGDHSRQTRADKRRENFRRHAADIARLESLREGEDG